MYSIFGMKFQHQCLRSWTRIPVMICGFWKLFKPVVTVSWAVIGQSSSLLQCHWMSPLMFDLKLLITMSKKKNYFSSSSDIHISWKTFKYLKVFWWLGYDPKWTLYFLKLNWVDGIKGCIYSSWKKAVDNNK